MAELPPVRRIVTAHGEDGKAVVRSDERFELQVWYFFLSFLVLVVEVRC